MPKGEFDMVKIGIFDIDFTITKRETLIQFYIFMMKRNPRLIKHLPRSLSAFFLYSIKYYDEKKVKQAFLRFIIGVDEKDMEILVKRFYSEVLSNIFYEDAISMIKKLKKEGCLIYLISASPEFYLKEMYAIPEVDKIIGTKVVVNAGKFAAEILGDNNKGQVKVKKLMNEIEKEELEVDWENSYMFSDSISDAPLLNLVGNPYLINYRKTHDSIEILKWR